MIFFLHYWECRSLSTQVAHDNNKWECRTLFSKFSQKRTLADGIQSNVYFKVHTEKQHNLYNNTLYYHIIQYLNESHRTRTCFERSGVSWDASGFVTLIYSSRTQRNLQEDIRWSLIGRWINRRRLPHEQT